MHGRPVGRFNPDSSANALGLYTKLGSQISCVPDAMYAPPEHLVRLILREVDPQFRPLWVTITWRSPNGGILRTGHHMLARHVLHPQRRAPVIKGLLLPTVPVYGIRTWRAPILLATILDGLTDEDRQKGYLPRYQPFDGEVVKSMRYAMHRRNNVHWLDRANAIEQGEVATEQKAQQEVTDGVAERKTDERLRILRAMGKADYVYVTDQNKKGAA